MNTEDRSVCILCFTDLSSRVSLQICLLDCLCVLRHSNFKRYPQIVALKEKVASLMKRPVLEFKEWLFSEQQINLKVSPFLCTAQFVNL